MTMGGFGMAQMMWQCWVQAKSDMIYTFKDQGTIGNFSVQNLGGWECRVYRWEPGKAPPIPDRRLPCQRCRFSFKLVKGKVDSWMEKPVIVVIIIMGYEKEPLQDEAEPVAGYGWQG